MKIILRADVENLGRLGDVVTVKAGYGRNYLLPQGLAMLVTPGNLKAFELERKKLQARMDALRAAADAAEGTRRRCEHFAQAGDCLWLQLPFTKAELGRALGRTAVAIAAVTDVGLAAALLHRLAELDPEQYADAADRMDVKARRAAERRAEQAAHEKNLRQGKRRRKAPPAPKAAKPPAEMPPERAPDGNRPRGAKPYRSRPPRDARPKPKAQARPYANSRPVKKGKGSFRKKKEG